MEYVVVKYFASDFESIVWIPEVKSFFISSYVYYQIQARWIIIFIHIHVGPRSEIILAIRKYSLYKNLNLLLLLLTLKFDNI